MKLKRHNQFASIFPTRLILCCGLAVAGFSSQVHADNIWDGGSTAVGGLWNWSDFINWGADTAPTLPGSLIFAGTSGLLTNNDLAAQTINGFTFSSGAGAFVLSGNAITLGGNITNSGTSLETINQAMATSAVRTVTTAASGGDVTLGGTLSGAGGGITKAGAGTLTLSGTVISTGVTSVNAGTLTLSGASNYVGNTLVNNGVLNVSGTIYSPGTTLTIGEANSANKAVVNVTGSVTEYQMYAGTSGASGALNLKSGGTITLVGPDSENSFTMGVNTNGYGYFNNSGGTLSTTRVQFGNQPGQTGGTGVGLMSAGTINNTSFLILARSGGSIGEFTITGGVLNRSVTGAGQSLGLGWDGAGGRAELNVLGGLINNSGGGGTVNYSSGGGTTTGILNLNGGTLRTSNFTKATGATAYFNFGGGTLQSSSSTTTFLPALSGVYVNGAFGTCAGGAVIDTNGFNDTIVAPLLAPTGSGLASLPLATQGSGYIGAPHVTITGTGTGATAIANMVDDGTGNGTLKVGTITITNPGFNYTGTPTFAFNGGGSTTAATAGTATLAANTSGGLTKNGTGILTLSGANTYTGTTVINSGTLQLGNGTSGTLAATALAFNGGAFTYQGVTTGSTQTLGALTFNAAEGTVQSTYGTSGITTIGFASLAARTAGGGTGNFVTSGGTNGSTNLIKFTSGPTAGALIDRGLFFNGSSYAAYDAGGFVRAYGVGDTSYVAAAGGSSTIIDGSTTNVALGGSVTTQAAATLNTLNLGNFTLGLNTGVAFQTDGILQSGGAASTLSGGTSLSTATASGELVVRSNLATDILAISTAIVNNTGATALTLGGAGKLTLSGANTYTGSTTINSGTLEIGGAGTLGSGTYAGNILDSGILLHSSSAAQTLSGAISGSGALTQSGAGTLTLSGANTYTGITTVSAGTLKLGNSSALPGTDLNLTGTLDLAGFNAASTRWTGVGGSTITNSSTVDSTLTSNLTASNTSAYNGAITTPSTGKLNFVFNSTAGGVASNFSLNAATTFKGTITVNGIGATAGTSGTLGVPNGAGDVTNVITLNNGGGLTSMYNPQNGGGWSSFSGTVLANPIVLSGTAGGVFRQGFTNLITYSGTISGTAGLTKTDSGTVNLTGANTYTGGTTLAGGTLALGSSGALSTTGNIVFSGGTLQYSASNTTDYSSRIDSGNSTSAVLIDTNGQNVTFASALSATKSGGLTKIGAGTLTLSGSSSYSAVTTFGGNASSIVNVTTLSNFGVAGSLGTRAADSGGNVGLLFQGGTLQYTGSTPQSTNRGIRLSTNGGGGNIDASGSNPSATVSFTATSTPDLFENGGARGLTLTGTNTGNNTFGIALSEAGGATNVNKSGPGSWILTGASTVTSTSTAYMIGGTLQVGNGSTGSLGSAKVSFLGTSKFIYQGVGTGSTQTLNSLTFSAGEGTLQSSYGGTSGITTLGFASLAARTAGATGNFVTSGGTNGTTNLIKFTTGPTAGTLIDRGLSFLGSNYAAYDTGGFVRAYGSGDAGYVTAAGGSNTIVTGATTSVALTGSVTTQAAVSINTLNLGASSLGLDTGVAFQTNGILQSGGASTLSGGTSLSTSTATTDLVIRSNLSTDTLGISTPIVNNTGATALTLGGAGKLTLSGANTYTGNTAINAGTLEIGATGTLGNGSYVGNISDFGALLHTSSAAQILSGVISGTGSLTQNSAGTLTLNALNTYTGQTTITSGTLSIGGSAGLYSAGTVAGAVLVQNGGTLQIGRSDVFGNAASNSPVVVTVEAGGLVLNGSGTVTILNNAVLNGGTISAGLGYNGTAPGAAFVLQRTVTVGGSIASNIISDGTTAATVGIGAVGNDSTTFNIADVTSSSAADLIVSAKLTNNFTNSNGLTKTGLGTMSLSGANTYSGNTLVSAGVLALDNNLALQNSAIDTSGAGTIAVTGFTTPTFGGLIGSVDLASVITTDYSSVTSITLNPASGVTNTYSGTIANGAMSLTKSGLGTQVLSGTNSYTGTTTVSAGTLKLGNSSALSAGALAVNGGTLDLAGFNTATTLLSGGGALTNSSATDSTLTVNLGASAAGSFGNISTPSTGRLNLVFNTNFSSNGSNYSLNNASTFKGAITVNGTGSVTGGSSLLGVGNNTALGDVTNVITLNNGGGLTTLYSPVAGNNWGGHNSGITVANPIVLSGTAGGVIRQGFNDLITLSGVVSGSTGLTQVDSGRVTLSGANTYTGVTTLSNGTLSVATIGDGGVVSGNLGSATNAAANLVFDGGTLQYTGATASTDRNFTINTGKTATFDIATPASTLTLTGVTTATNGSLAKTGTGKLVLSGTTSSYGGTTIMSGGILNVASLSNFGVDSSIGNRTADAAGDVGLLFRGGTLQYSGSTAQSTNRGVRISTTGGGIIDASGSSPTATLSFTAASSADFFENAGARGLTLTGSNTGDNTFGIAIGQAGAVTNIAKTGVGTWILTGANTYGGITAINAGILRITTSAGLGAGGFSGTTMTTIANNAALELQGDLTISEHFHMQGAGPSGLGVLHSLSGNSSLTTNFAIDNNSTFGVDAGTLTIASSIYHDSGSYGITKVGAGKLVFSGGNIYTGDTTVSDGTLLVNGSIIGAGAVNVGASGTLGGTGSITGLTSVASGGTLAPGASAGTLNFAGGLTLAGGSIFNWENNTVNTLGTAGTHWDVANVTGGATTISSTPTTGAKLKLMFTDALTNFADSFWDSNQSWKFITGGVSATNLFDSTNIAVLINSVQQGLTNIITGEGAFSTAVNGSDLELLWTADIGGAPEIAISQSGDIASGGSKNFGSIVVGANTSLTFTIANIGTADLNLTGTPKVAVSGDADFTVTAQPTTPVSSPTGTTTFTVQFAPTISGARNATLTILNDDSDEGSFTINLSGNGATLYAVWALANGLDGTPGKEDGVSANPDGDASINSVEFAFDTDPLNSTSAPIAYVSGGSVTTHGTPVILKQSGLYYAVFGQRTDHVDAGLTYKVQFSADMSGAFWQDSAGTPSQVASDGVIDAVRVPYPLALIPSASGPQKARFFRVQVSIAQ